jgi:hypothetical protein
MSVTPSRTTGREGELKTLDEVLADLRETQRRARAINEDPAWQMAGEFAARTLDEIAKIVKRHRRHELKHSGRSKAGANRCRRS